MKGGKDKRTEAVNGKIRKTAPLKGQYKRYSGSYILDILSCFYPLRGTALDYPFSHFSFQARL